MNDCLKRGWGWGLILLLGASLIPVGPAGAKEKVLIVGDYSPVNNLDPTSSVISQYIMFSRNLFQGLLRYKFNSTELEGDLAKSWTLSKDRLVYTFKLRDNIKWHKGFGKVTAQDVKFSFDRVMDPETRSPFRGEVVAVEKFGKDFARNPIGTGPFIFDSWTREQVVLLGNKEFQQREGPPKIDKMIYKAVPDVDTLLMALQKGDVDVVWVLPRDQAVIDRLKASGCKIIYGKRPTWQNRLMNTKKKPFDDIRVRRAIAHAIDKETLIKHVFGDMAERQDTPIPKGFFGHTEEGVPRYEYNPQKAKELLAQAGYPNGFEVNLDTFQAPSYLPLATAIADQLRKVGVVVKLVVTDQATWVKQLYEENIKFSLNLPSFQPDPDILIMRYYHSSGELPIMRDASAVIDKLDDLIEKARKERNEKIRFQYYHEFQKKFMEALPDIPLMMVDYPLAFRSHISGLPERDFI